MDKESFDCKILTEMFCYGADKNLPEIRAASLKGLLRYTYRVACQNSTPNRNLEPKKESQELLKKEGFLFGSASDEQLRPSPLRLAIIDKKKEFDYKRPVMHKNNKKKCISSGTLFSIQLRLLHENSDSKDSISKNIEWYTKLFKLSLLLFGMGQRNRRGRGCISVDKPKSLIDTKKEILEYLKCISDCDTYQLDSNYENINVVTKGDNPAIIRPVIKNIFFGKSMKKDQKEIEIFLKKVDNACHEIKKYYPRYNEGYYITGYARKNRNGEQERFSSSIIVSLAETEKNILPIYTCVKPVLKDKRKHEWNDEAYEEEKKAFINLIESKGVRI